MARETTVLPAQDSALLDAAEALLREGLVRLLTEAGCEVVGSAANAVELHGLVARTAPDVVLVDIRMPPTHTDEGLVAAAAWETHDGKLAFKGGTARTNSHWQNPSGWCAHGGATRCHPPTSC